MITSQTGCVCNARAVSRDVRLSLMHVRTSCFHLRPLSVFLSYLGDRVHGHQPGDEALVPGDVGQHGRVAVADGHCPGHAGVEVVIHADCQTGWFGRGPGQGDCLCGVAVPGVADAV